MTHAVEMPSLDADPQDWIDYWREKFNAERELSAELLEALKNFVTITDPDNKYERELNDQAKAAIKKAEGANYGH